MPSVDLAAEIQRGREAKALLSHPLLTAAFKDIEQSLTKAWLGSPVRDPEGREMIFLAMQSLLQVQGYLKVHLETGKMAEIQLQREQNVVN